MSAGSSKIIMLEEFGVKYAVKSALHVHIFNYKSQLEEKLIEKTN